MDCIFVSVNAVISDVNNMCQFSTSDHALTRFKYNISKLKNATNNARNFKLAGYKGFQNYLASMQWNVVFATDQSVNEICLSFIRIINHGIEMLVSITKVVESTKKYYPYRIKRVLAKKRHLRHERFALNDMSKYKTWADKCKRFIMKYQASKELKLTTNKENGRAYYK